MDFPTKLKNDLENGQITEVVYATFSDLYGSYVKTLESAGIDYSEHSKFFDTYLRLVKEQLKSPYPFGSYHQKITKPFDHHKFGMDLFSPMVDWQRSHLFHEDNLVQMEKQLSLGENVILFANHQTEVDPQLLKIILSKHGHKRIAEEIIFVAGDRVVTDPMAVPLSLGCDLLCIYSKRYIDNPPEEKEEKLLHNQKTMKVMKQLLADGSKMIYVAPSGGRDRPDKTGELVLATFDPQSIEMFRLMGMASKKPTHFYPLALKTYAILPPPDTINRELGEARLPQRHGIQFSFGSEIDMDHFPAADMTDKHSRRIARGLHIFSLVKHHYAELT